MTTHPGELNVGPAAGTRSWDSVYRAFGRPYLAFLGICAVYLSFPSREFGVDALHYGLHALFTAHGEGSLFTDVSVPVHLAWHVIAVGILRATGAEQPLESLYTLEFFNIVTALAAIFVFMRLVRSFAGTSLAVSATIVLAFSHACLRFFLSVEVYALNNLALTALALFAYCCCVGGADGSERLGYGRVAILALLSMAAVTTHLSNLLIVPSVLLFFVFLNWRLAVQRAAVYLSVVASMSAVLVLWVSYSTGGTLARTIAYILGYSAKADRYVPGGPIDNAWSFLIHAPEAALGSYGLLLYLPLAGFLVLAILNAKDLWAHPFVRFLCALLAPMLAFYSQWDTANVEHKIAILPLLLLLVTYSVVVVGKERSLAVRLGAPVLATAFVIVGITQGIAPYRNIEDNELYRLSAAIRHESEAPIVAVVGLADPSSSHPVVMSSATFFGQEIVLLDDDAVDFPSTLGELRTRDIPVLVHQDGQFHPQAGARSSR